MSTEENKALVRRFYDEVSNGRNLAVLDEILSPNFEGFKVEGEEHCKRYHKRGSSLKKVSLLASTAV